LQAPRRGAETRFHFKQCNLNCGSIYQATKKGGIMQRHPLITFVILMAMLLPFTYGGCGGSGGSGSDGQVWVAESFSFDVVVDTQERLLINAVAGSIEIAGSSTADTVIIEGERRVGSKTREDAELHLDMLEVSVEDLDSEIRVETIQPEKALGRNYEVNYRITVPDNLEVYVNQVAGPVLIDTIRAAVSVNTVSGDIDLIEITGSAQASVFTGQVNSQVTLPLNGTIELSTLTGDIDAEVSLPHGGTIDITALEGDINLDIPQDTSAAFSAGITDGVIQLIDLVLHNQTRTAHSLTGRLGDGDGEIWLETEAGNIIVTGF
jgi:DUF4097 and DUF4098 domain-containing protein YvlB